VGSRNGDAIISSAPTFPGRQAPVVKLGHTLTQDRAPAAARARTDLNVVPLQKHTGGKKVMRRGNVGGIWKPDKNNGTPFGDRSKFPGSAGTLWIHRKGLTASLERRRTAFNGSGRRPLTSGFFGPPADVHVNTTSRIPEPGGFEPSGAYRTAAGSLDGPGEPSASASGSLRRARAR